MCCVVGYQIVNMSGPDVVLEADNLTTWERGGAVKLRIEEDSKFNPKPESIITFFRERCKAGGSHKALSVKRDGQWQHWTYAQYYDDVRTVAKAFIKLGLEELCRRSLRP